MTKIFKKALTICALASSAALPLATTISCSSDQVYMTGKGSNSVSPIIMNYAMKNAPNAYTYSNTGSSDGFKSQVGSKPSFDFGMTSSLKVPGTQRKTDGENQKDIDDWTRNHIRTLTWGIDAIALGVNLPQGLTINNNETPKVNALMLAKLFKGQDITWEQLLDNESSTGSHAIRVIYIKGGEDTSGKSEAFVKGLLKNPLVKNDNEFKNMDKHQNEMFKFHSYKMKNSIAFDDDFAKIYDTNDKVDGTLTYYALGQIASIEKRYGSTNSVQIAAVSGFGLDNTVPTSDDARNKAYKWTRPFNMLYSTDNKTAVNFAKWLLSPTLQDILSKYFVSLSATVIKQQLDNIEKPDFTNNKVIGLHNKPTLNDAKSLVLGLEV